jgi:hypothetical protein
MHCKIQHPTIIHFRVWDINLSYNYLFGFKIIIFEFFLLPISKENFSNLSRFHFQYYFCDKSSILKNMQINILKFK